MTLRIADVMTTDVRTVDVKTPVAELERTLITRQVSGFPVVDAGNLVGLVSRSDIVRMLDVERAQEEQISDYHRMWAPENDAQASSDTGARIGARMEGKTAGDVMVKSVITCSPDQSLREAAIILAEHEIHRLPVVDGDKLVGILTSMDLVRVIAEDRH